MQPSTKNLHEVGSLIRTVIGARQHVEQARSALQEARRVLVVAQKLTRPLGTLIAKAEILPEFETGRSRR